MLEPDSREMDTMINPTPILVAVLALMLSAPSSADDLTDAAEGLCDTIRSCALEAVAGEVKTPECTEYDRLVKAASAAKP